MQDEELKYWIAFTYLYRNNVPKQKEFLAAYHTIDEVWAHVTEEGKKDAEKKAARELEFIHKHGIQVLAPTDAAYSNRLRECVDAPTLLYTKGKINFNEGKFLSVVGTRSATEQGKDITRQIILDLAHKVPNLTIVSGLAYGIDVAAHKAALEAGLPTIAVLGHGLDRIYPTVHRSVAIEILKSGGLVTEYPSEVGPDGWNFVARDRIIAGLSDATLVVESKARGGSLITAGQALDYGRDVFAVPGRVWDVNAAGCNQLIRDQRAMLVTNADDIVSAMQWESVPVQTELDLADVDETLEPLALRILQYMHEEEADVHINQLVMAMEAEYQEVVTQLIYLEMQGYIRTLAGGYYHLTK